MLDFYFYSLLFVIPTFLCFRALCELIGEKTNVYSLEISMWGHDVKVRKELSKRELAKMGLKDDQKMPLEDKTISYTKEDCKSLKMYYFSYFRISVYIDIRSLF